MLKYIYTSQTYKQNYDYFASYTLRIQDNNSQNSIVVYIYILHGTTYTCRYICLSIQTKKLYSRTYPEVIYIHNPCYIFM